MNCSLCNGQVQKFLKNSNCIHIFCDSCVSCFDEYYTNCYYDGCMVQLNLQEKNNQRITIVKRSYNSESQGIIINPIKSGYQKQQANQFVEQDQISKFKTVQFEKFKSYCDICKEGILHSSINPVCQHNFCIRCLRKFGGLCPFCQNEEQLINLASQNQPGQNVTVLHRNLSQNVVQNEKPTLQTEQEQKIRKNKTIRAVNLNQTSKSDLQMDDLDYYILNQLKSEQPTNRLTSCKSSQSHNFFTQQPQKIQSIYSQTTIKRETQICQQQPESDILTTQKIMNNLKLGVPQQQKLNSQYEQQDFQPLDYDDIQIQKQLNQNFDPSKQQKCVTLLNQGINEHHLKPGNSTTQNKISGLKQLQTQQYPDNNNTKIFSFLSKNQDQNNITQHRIKGLKQFQSNQTTSKLNFFFYNRFRNKQNQP